MTVETCMDLNIFVGSYRIFTLFHIKCPIHCLDLMWAGSTGGYPFGFIAIFLFELLLWPCGWKDITSDMTADSEMIRAAISLQKQKSTWWENSSWWHWTLSKVPLWSPWGLWMDSYFNFNIVEEYSYCWIHQALCLSRFLKSTFAIA